MQATPDPKDKVNLTIGLLTILVTVIISGYKNSLSEIVISGWSYQFSLFDLLIWTSVSLFGSIYFSAIDNLKATSIKIVHPILIDGCGFISDLLYTIAILILPTFFLVVYLLSSIIYWLISNPIIPSIATPAVTQILENTLSILSIIASVLGAIVSIYATIQERKDLKDKIRNGD